MEEPGAIEVTVKTLDSQSRTFTVRGEWTVKQFKEHIASAVEIPVDKQRLIYQGKVLQDESTLTEYNVDGKVIHLVERAPPQSSQSGDGRCGVSGSSGTTDGGSTSSQSSTFPGTPHDRNANNYVMLGTFNLPMLAGVGEMGRNVRVSTSTGSSGSVDVHINVDQSVQSEPRMRLQLADSLLRETQALIHRLEPSSSSFSSQPMDSSPPPPSSSSSASQTEGCNFFPCLNSHPSPLELVEVLSEVRRVEERLRPFMERTHSILGAANSADYNNNTQEREEDQRTLNLIGESLHLLGNTLVALSDLRCNLSAQPPRHLHVVRPMSHYTSPVVLQSGPPHIPIPMNLGSTMTMTANSRQTSEGQAQTSQPSNQSEPQGQAPPPPPNGASQQTGHGQGTPRVIRITHQTMEPVVMMQMNLDGMSPTRPIRITAGKGTTAPIHVPGLPPEFMQAIIHQISQQAVAMATAASAGHQGQQQGTAGTGAQSADSPAPPPPQARGNPMTSSPLTQMVSGLVGQLLMPLHTGDQTSTTSSSHSFSFSTSTATPSSSSISSSTAPPSSTNTSGQTSTHTTSTASMGQSQEGGPGDNLAQLLGSLLGGFAGAGGGVSGGPPSITVTVPGVPAFIQGLSEFIQSGQPVFPPPNQQPPPSQATPSAPSGAAHTTAPQPPSGGGETLSPELFTGIVQGVLSTMMGSLGAGQGNTESIAQFIQRLSQTSNLFTPGTGDAVGFFGDLLSLVCQSFSMVDMVLLLHGNPQPLSRVQPQLTAFFTEHYLQGLEPTDANIASAAEDLINGLEEYIAESFSTVTVRLGVDIIQTNISFLRQQFTRMATHILRCTDNTFGQRLLHMCTQGLFECLALNLYCLRGEQRALTTVINHRIRRMSAEVNPSLVNWLTSMMSMRLHVILEHNPVSEDQIQHYVLYTQVFTLTSGFTPKLNHRILKSICFYYVFHVQSESSQRIESDAHEWVPIIRHDMLTQRKMKAQPPLSDAYLHGMPAKRRKTTQGEGPHLSLSEAVSRAARTAGVRPVTAPDSLQGELEASELQEAYTQQVKSDIKKRLSDDPDYNHQRFPNTHRAFSEDS
uniref:Large proline-rich protein BAG6 n=1 Tax=Sinocyclocheilus rhinocerous TaxID=307959 RepID=A0A673LWD5_9TELE